MRLGDQGRGHAAAAVTVIIWGMTLAATKVLLVDFSAFEIMAYRAIVAYVALLAIYPKPILPRSWREELKFAVMGLFGLTLYFLLQNIGLTYTLATNSGVILSANPLFTALGAHFVMKTQKLNRRFLTGFCVAITGIVLVTCNGTFALKLNPLGDILTLAAALCWAVYSNLLGTVGEDSYTVIQKTRKTFFWGIVFMIPAMYFFDFRWGFARFAEPANLLWMLFLALGASALCFLTWNYAVGRIGPVKSCIYIYAVPIVNIFTAMIVIGEKMSPGAAVGTALILFGLVWSEWDSLRKSGTPEQNLKSAPTEDLKSAPEKGLESTQTEAETIDRN